MNHLLVLWVRMISNGVRKPLPDLDHPIVIANNDEISIAHETARNKNKKSKSLTTIEKSSLNKSLMVSKNNKVANYNVGWTTWYW